MQKKEVFLNFLQNNSVETIKSTSNIYLKELMVFWYDEIKQQNILEKMFFSTNYGGDKFYSNIDIMIEENNLEMLELYLLCLKLGFNGSSEKKRKIYSQKLEKLFEPMNNNVEKKTFIPMKKTFFAHWWKILLLFIILIVILELYYLSSFLIIRNFEGKLFKV